jgi:hypothetical protein
MRYTGAGIVMKAGETLARVNYDLVRTTHYLALDNDKRVEAVSVIYGEIHIVTGTIPQGELLLLRLENGRVVSLYAHNPSISDILKYPVTVIGDPG